MEKDIPDLYRKHRPKSFKQVIGQDETVKIMEEKLAKKAFPRVILLSGPSGCGKSTFAYILRTKLNCSDHDFTEMNAADTRGIDAVRAINDTMKMSSFVEGGSRLYLLDEVHQLTSQAMSSLLVPLENPGECYFILCTTNPEKLLPTILNRCVQFKLKPLSLESIKTVIDNVLKKEQLELSDKVIKRLAETADGSARMALQLLNKVLALSDEQEQLDALIKSDTKKKGFDIAQGLIWKRLRWPEIAEMLKEIDDEPVAIRKIICACASKELLKGGKGSDRAYLILLAFDERYPEMTDIVKACYEVFKK